MSFFTRIIVRFGDVDSAGLVYYPRIFHYFHIALEEFFAARCGTPYYRLISEERIGFPTVKTETEFLSPLVYGDEIDVSVRVARIGETSVTFEYNIRRAGDEKLCVRSILGSHCNESRRAPCRFNPGKISPYFSGK